MDFRQVTKNNSNSGGKSEDKVATIYYLKCIFFPTKKVEAYIQTVKYNSYIGKNSQ